MVMKRRLSAKRTLISLAIGFLLAFWALDALAAKNPTLMYPAPKNCPYSFESALTDCAELCYAQNYHPVAIVIDSRNGRLGCACYSPDTGKIKEGPFEFDY